MWWLIGLGLLVVVVLTLVLSRRGASGPGSADTWRDAGAGPESTRLPPDNSGGYV